ncbi:DUF559 domain-containing protein [Sphingomonas sp. BGYR3]|uniref:endonuclease domain-containing protein n=1 Tax=Sphingomonas sp. BGYR3 TaxID=2975483 RepID=UPI0021A8BA30|nr:DUF559 domain-containing protein [Sphingomonas sp. BGYR3]MDG5489415.1 DUF559 domain-containing protein [Sphingomonas sp. BGYR3]
MLRRSMSLPEVLLWRALRRRSLGAKFRRQHPLPPYVLDFYCPAARLVVEIDGKAHANRLDHDRRRDDFLRGKGLTVLRIPARDVLSDPDHTAEAIMAWASPLHPSPAASGPPPHAMHGEDRLGA